MRKYSTAIHRRRFLQQSAALGLGTLFAPALASKASAATKDRIAIYQGVSLDSLHPYGYSGGGITAIWRHILEPLIQMDYDRNEYVEHDIGSHDIDDIVDDIGSNLDLST